MVKAAKVEGGLRRTRLFHQRRRYHRSHIPAVCEISEASCIPLRACTRLPRIDGPPRLGWAYKRNSITVRAGTFVCEHCPSFEHFLSYLSRRGVRLLTTAKDLSRVHDGGEGGGAGCIGKLRWGSGCPRHPAADRCARDRLRILESGRFCLGYRRCSRGSRARGVRCTPGSRSRITLNAEVSLNRSESGRPH